MRSRIVPRAVGALALALLVASCSGPREARVTAPEVGSSAAIPYFGDPELQPGGPPAPEIRNVWPNQDQLAWAYAMSVRDIGTAAPFLYPTADEVPPITLDEAAAMLATPVTGTTIQTGSFHLRFNGTRTTQSGAVGQNLEESTVVGGVPVPVGTWSDRFLARLAVARPGLRDRLGARLRLEAGPAGAPITPQFLFGYVWELTDDHIGTYGDLDLQLAWKFLESDLDPGHEFTHQLVPALADDIFLYVRMLPRATVSTPNGTFGKCVRALYVVDYGVGQWVDDFGNPQGYYRWVDYGIIAYAAGYGPVAEHERQLGSVGAPPNLGRFEVQLDLMSRTSPAVMRPSAQRF